MGDNRSTKKGNWKLCFLTYKALLGSINIEVLIWLPLRDVGRENLCLRAQVRLRKQKLKSIQPVNTGMGISINQYQHQLQVLSSLIFRHCCDFILV